MPSLVLAQSLTELAEREKERRKKNQESGEQVQVITDRELVSNQGRIANPDATAPPAEPAENAATSSTPPPPGPGRGDSDSEDTGGDDEGFEDDDNEDDFQEEEVTDIPADTSLEDKLRLLESMKTSYQAQVREIDAEIQKNNQRLTEIQDELVSTGGTGLPTAPQVDLNPRNPGNIPGLRSEQQALRDRNQALEAQKQSAREDIIARARRAGIPSSYLNF